MAEAAPEKKVFSTQKLDFLRALEKDVQAEWEVSRMHTSLSSHFPWWIVRPLGLRHPRLPRHRCSGADSHVNSACAQREWLVVVPMDCGGVCGSAITATVEPSTFSRGF